MSSLGSDFSIRRWPSIVRQLTGELPRKRRQTRQSLTRHFAYRCLAMLEKI